MILDANKPKLWHTQAHKPQQTHTVRTQHYYYREKQDTIHRKPWNTVGLADRIKELWPSFHTHSLSAALKHHLEQVTQTEEQPY